MSASGERKVIQLTMVFRGGQRGRRWYVSKYDVCITAVRVLRAPLIHPPATPGYLAEHGSQVTQWATESHFQRNESSDNWKGILHR
jgi:hypothetical protein